MGIAPEQDWLKAVQGVGSDADIAGRLAGHWRQDAALLAEAIAQIGSCVDTPLFHVAMRDFDRQVGAV